MFRYMPLLISFQDYYGICVFYQRRPDNAAKVNAFTSGALIHDRNNDARVVTLKQPKQNIQYSWSPPPFNSRFAMKSLLFIKRRNLMLPPSVCTHRCQNAKGYYFFATAPIRFQHYQKFPVEFSWKAIIMLPRRCLHSVKESQTIYGYLLLATVISYLLLTAGIIHTTNTNMWFRQWICNAIVLPAVLHNFLENIAISISNIWVRQYIFNVEMFLLEIWKHALQKCLGPPANCRRGLWGVAQK